MVSWHMLGWLVCSSAVDPRHSHRTWLSKPSRGRGPSHPIPLDRLAKKKRPGRISRDSRPRCAEMTQPLRCISSRTKRCSLRAYVPKPAVFSNCVLLLCRHDLASKQGFRKPLSGACMLTRPLSLSLIPRMMSTRAQVRVLLRGGRTTQGGDDGPPRPPAAPRLLRRRGG